MLRFLEINYFVFMDQLCRRCYVCNRFEENLQRKKDQDLILAKFIMKFIDLMK